MPFPVAVPFAIGSFSLLGAQAAYDSVVGLGDDATTIARTNSAAGPNDAGTDITAPLTAAGEIINQPAQLVGNAAAAIVEPVAGGLAARAAGAAAKAAVVIGIAWAGYKWLKG